MFFLTPPTISYAQESGSAYITPPETDSFPVFSTTLIVYDSKGDFIHNLKASDIQLLENGNPVNIMNIQEMRPGAQIAVAINPGPPFAIQNSQAVSRYDFIVEALTRWGNSRIGTDIDDMSLLTAGGASSSHVIDPEDWVTVLTSGKVDARTANPTLDILFQAQTLVSDAPNRPGMGRAILFITPPLEGLLDETFQNAITQARQNNTRINVWMVTSPGTYSTKSSNQLAGLAEDTEGSFFIFTGEEDLPDPEIYFDSLRSIYQLQYQSGITTSGNHHLQAQVETQTEPVSTLPQTFSFDIQPPLPSIISPPLVITRSPENNFSGDEFEPLELMPRQQLFSAVIEFPDGKTREITRSALLVDNQVVDMHTSSPFDQFKWELEAFNESGSHTVQIEVEDNLGLIGRSAEMPIQIQIVLPEPTPLSTAYKNLPVIAVLFLTMSGSILLLFLILTGKIKPRLPGRSPKWRRAQEFLEKPAAPEDGSNRKMSPGWVNTKITDNTIAVLVPLPDPKYTSGMPTIALEKNQITFGMDPDLVDICFDDPALEKLHARLVYESDGNYRLYDERSTAGTWINYTLVPQEGVYLEHADLVHFGMIGFLFKWLSPSKQLVPHIEKLTGTDGKMGV